MSEHAFSQLLAIGDAPLTHTVEQCTRCGVVRVTEAEAWAVRSAGTVVAIQPLRVWSTVRWYDKGEAVEPREDCQ